MRETLYEDQGATARLVGHRRVASVLEARYAAGPESHLEELAHHFFHAAIGGDVQRAVVYEAKAGERALVSAAYEKAVAHYERALQALALGPPDEARQGDLLLALADSRQRSGERDDARETFERVAALARRRRDGAMLGRAALGMTQGFAGLGITSGAVDWPAVRLLEEALAANGEDDGPMTARLLGRLAMELYWSGSASRRASSSERAVEIARRLRDPALLAHALSARHVALWTPDNAAGRLDTASEIVCRAADAGEHELALRARIWRLTALLETADVGRADREFEELQREAGEPASPLLRWFSAVWRAMRAGLEGRFDDAERRAEEALEIGRRAQDPDAMQAFAAQLIALGGGRGLEQFQEQAARLVEQYPESSVWRSVMALIHCDSGREAEARREFEYLATGDFADIPRDAHWLVTLVNLAQTCCFLFDKPRAAVLYDLLLPFADRCVVVSTGLACLGSVARPLGMLATAMARWEEAESHFQSALRANADLRARSLVALTKLGYAMMLIARHQPGDRDRLATLLLEVLDLAEQLDMRVLAGWARRLQLLTGTSAVEEPAAPDAPSSDVAVFREEGELWTIARGRDVVRVKATLGLRYLARLLRHPGAEFHAAELLACDAAASAGPPDPGAQPEAQRGGLQPPVSTDAGEHLDRRAASEYRRQLRELEGELQEVQDLNDLGRVAKIRSEMEFLTAELGRALGLGGRSRRAGSSAERARVSVTRAIQRAIEAVTKRSDSLGPLLQTTIHTGNFCSYRPDPRFPITWEF